MHLKITINQQPTDIQVDEKCLAYLKENTLTEIQYDGQLTLQIAAQLSLLLQYNGTLLGKFDDNGVIFLESCGLYRIEDQKFQKKPLATTQLIERTLTNAYGKYDYIELKFINSTNPFKQIITQGQEIINEDELLNDGVQVKQVESCASKPRACANCTCGRKELEEQLDKETLIDQLKNQSVSGSCGSCYLGDAFRCANCPYRGLPAFKDGEQVKVLQGGAQLNVESSTDKVQIKDGKVKLQL